MASDFLSNIELYFVENDQIRNGFITIVGKEFHHIVKVMRHKVNDLIFITNGAGKIFESKITDINKSECICEISKTLEYENSFSNVFLCLPQLKNSNRFEFALEKCVELGVTNFKFFNSEKSLLKNYKPDRINRILLAAMKQSCRSFLPKYEIIDDLSKLNDKSNDLIVFDQQYDYSLKNYLADSKNIKKENRIVFVFGPEGGLTNKDLHLLSDYKKMQLAKNRLRSETAVIYTASLLNRILEN